METYNSPEFPLRMGIAGLGRAASAMLPSLVAHPDIRVVAAADPSAAARERAAALYNAATYETLEDLLKADAVDALYIATPHQFHLQHALLAARASMHFIIEKPLALSVDDCSRIVDAVQQSGVIALVGHTHGFDPGVRKMRELIHSGRYGRLRMMASLAYTDFLYRPRRPEELDTNAGGGVFFNQVPHQVDAARVLAQEPIRSVRSTAGVWDSSRPTEGAMSAFIEFESGVTASLVYSGYDHLDSDEFCEWIGVGGRSKRPAHGSARSALAQIGSAREAEARVMRGVAGPLAAEAPEAPGQPHFGLMIVSCDGADMRISKDGVRVYDDHGVQDIRLPAGRATPNRDAVADDFVAAVRLGRPPLQDAAWGLRTMEAIRALQTSARERREIRMDLATDREQ